MTDKKVQLDEVDVVRRARGFWTEYNRPVMIISSAVVIILAGWLVYKYMFKLPKETKANDVVFVTQKYFSQLSNAPSDSGRALIAAKVLNGDGVNPGALKIINNYSGTAAANLSKYYAGASYLQLKQFDKAIKFLKDFDADGALQIKVRAYGMIADASAELNKNDQALEYYKKAANADETDDFNSSEFLFRAALFAQVTGKSKEAIDLFKKLKNDYPLSQRSFEVDRYLARLGEF